MNNKYTMVIGGLIMSSFAVGGTYINNSVEVSADVISEVEEAPVVEEVTTEQVNENNEVVELEAEVAEFQEATETTEDNTENNSEEVTETLDEVTETAEMAVSTEEVYTVTENTNTSLSSQVEEYVTNMDVQIEYVKRSDYDGEIPNEMNEVVIAMYHGINPNTSNADEVHRSVEGFKQDLQTLYDNGYRAITMEDLMNNNINVPAGYTPIVLTFDDGLSSQFSLVRDENGDLVPKEDSAVDIINEFNETHPDFGTSATFFVYTSQRPFKGDGTVDECFDYLTEHGYEVGAHTYSHPFLTKLSSDKIQNELAYNVGYIAKHSDDLTMSDIKYLAYPYGDIPEDDRKSVLLAGQYGDYIYEFDAGLIASPNFNNSSLMYSNDFDRYKVGRYRGTDNAVYDLMFKVRQDEKHPENKFISDGDANVVTILEEDFDKVNLETLKGKKLVVITE